MDLAHMVSRGNRRFVIMKSERDMRGFILSLKRMTPTLVRNQVLIEVQGAERFIADEIFVPEERRGLYGVEDAVQEVKFARGRIIKDKLTHYENALEERKRETEIIDKLDRIQGIFTTEFERRSRPE